MDSITVTEEIKNARYSPEDLDTYAMMPCNKCGQLTATNVAFSKTYKSLMGGTCKKCHHANYCFLFAKEMRKCTYRKNQQDHDVAQFQLGNCEQSFYSNYQLDWRTHMLEVRPTFDKELGIGLNEPLELYSLIQGSKERGYFSQKTIATQTTMSESAFYLVQKYDYD